MRILGLDIGDKRIGIAVSDKLGHTAQGLSVMKRKDRAGDLKHIQQLTEELGVDEVIVGIPLKMDGTKGSQAQKVIDFAQEMQKKLKLPVRLWDERLTSKAANKTLVSADVGRKLRKKVVDKVAAALILQSYLDSKKS